MTTFNQYIARDLQRQLGESLHKANFYSIQMDGSTDLGNKEEELFLILIPSVLMAVYMSLISTCVCDSQDQCVLLVYLKLLRGHYLILN